MKRTSFIFAVLLFIPLCLSISTYGIEVPLQHVKSVCLDRIDITKAKLYLPEIGRGCVNEDWLETISPEDGPAVKVPRLQNSDKGTVLEKEQFSRQPLLENSYWNKVPEDWKFNVVLSDDQGSDVFQVSGHVMTEKIMQKIWDHTPSGKLRKRTEIQYKTYRRVFPYRTGLKLWVLPLQDGREFFPPLSINMGFTQNDDKYSVNPLEKSAIILDGSFYDTKMKKGKVTRGIIAIPTKVNLKRKFVFWYKNQGVEVGKEGFIYE